MTLTRYLGGFVRSQVEHCTEVLWRFTLARLRASPLGAVLDLDSTVCERYGHQEGALRGHNPPETQATLPPSAPGDVGRGESGV